MVTTPIEPCPTCSFSLFNPVAKLSVSDWGIYDDSRFPGRSIVKLRNHQEDFGELNPSETAEFMADVQTVMGIIKNLTHADRVNVAILGNAVPHVHAHLIPRFSAEEPHPNQSPWNDTRRKEALPPAVLEELTTSFSSALN